MRTLFIALFIILSCQTTFATPKQGRDCSGCHKMHEKADATLILDRGSLVSGINFVCYKGKALIASKGYDGSIHTIQPEGMDKLCVGDNFNLLRTIK